MTNDVFTKLANAVLPTGEIIAVRGMIGLSLMLPFVLYWNGWRLPGVANRQVLLRSACEAGAAVLYLTALFSMPFANASAIVQVLPLLITVLAVLILKEAVGWRRWAAILVGFAGMLLIVKPGMAGFNTYAWIAVIAVGFMSIRDIISRFIPATIPSTVATVTTMIVVMLAGFGLSAFEDWQPIDLKHFGLLACSAVFVICGNFFMIVAARTADIGVVAPFRYTVMIWAIAYGLLVWGEFPDTLALSGTALIILSGLYVFHRESMAGSRNG
ncbi:MAG: DMT family transporter [Rhodobiaceae bacterium]|nr:DMT family transporter [Rhodobiaceae bacterium]